MTDDQEARTLQEALRLVDVELRRGGHQWRDEAGADSVRHFAWGIGDENPLFCDPSYGAGTRWGSALAPGCYLYSVDDTVIAPGLPGLQWFYLGTEWEFTEPIRVGDRLTASARLVGAEFREGRRAGRYLVQTGEVVYRRQDGAVLARAVSRTARIPRKPSKDAGLRYKEREPYRYTDEELERIEADILAEEVRGAKPRHWEEVAEGGELRPVVKGPLGMSDMIAYYCGTGTIYRAHERAWRHRLRHPDDAVRDEGTNTSEHPAHSHHDRARAIAVGMPGQYDVGMQRIAWLGHLLTNWCGDDGSVRRLSVDLLRPNLFGDTTWCRGRVTAKREEDGRALVDCELWTENQRGDVATRGSATVELPRRSSPSSA